MQLFSRYRMDETQFCGMQGNPRCTRAIHSITSGRRSVDPLAADRVPTFRKVDANLVSPARLQPTFDQRVGIAKMLNRPNVSNRPLPLAAAAGASPAITPIPDQVGDDGSCADAANSDGEITSLGRVLTELLSQNSAGRYGTGKDKQSTGLAVDTMHGTNGSPPSLRWRTGRPLGSAAAGLAHLKPADDCRQ